MTNKKFAIKGSATKKWRKAGASSNKLCTKKTRKPAVKITVYISFSKNLIDARLKKFLNIYIIKKVIRVKTNIKIKENKSIFKSMLNRDSIALTGSNSLIILVNGSKDCDMTGIDSTK